MTVCLAFDTAGPACAAALSLDGRTSTRIETMARGQAEYLMGMLEEMLGTAGLNWGDLDLIGVGTGPGNFTGIRIAVAAARGLALALDIPAIGIDAFAAARGTAQRPGWVAIGAPRGQVWLRYGDAEGARPPESAPRDRLATLSGAVIRYEEVPPAERIATVAFLARARAAEPGFSPSRPAPLYLRPADAAPPRDPPPAILP